MLGAAVTCGTLTGAALTVAAEEREDCRSMYVGKPTNHIISIVGGRELIENGLGGAGFFAGIREEEKVQERPGGPLLTH